jgi:7,8-dihydropterin-6-yl-methyl-4-(beta-D-ribofuranosyl)aminobenzene 5'-phosphate synthase
MEKGMNRREFLRATATTGMVFLTGNFLQGVSWAQGVVKIPESEKIVISVITDNYADFLRKDYKIAKRPAATSPLADIFHAEHGLAYQIETVVNGESHFCIFDFAVDPQGVIRNMKLLNIDFTKIEALGLSHPHFDHFNAMNEILKTYKDSIRKGIPFYVGEQFFGKSGRIPFKREDIEGLGIVKIVEIKEPTPIIPGAYLPGKIELVTDYETKQEILIGEQAVILNAKGKGLVVLSGCAHRGIVNTVKKAQKMTGIEKVCAVMGGFHLINANPEVIKKSVADIKAINPEYIIPMHCTGYEGISAFADEMPNQFILNTAGTKYIITA